MNKAATNLLLLSTGLLAGAAIGILYAPDEGRNTRDRISFQLSKYRERLAELIGKMQEAEGAVASEAKSESDRIIHDTKVEAERLLGHVEALMSQIKDQKSS